MAIYYSTGTICTMSDVQSGTSKTGKQWQRMTIVIEIPGYQGATTKQVFQCFGDVVMEVMKFSLGDRVECGFTVYAREWNGRLWNNVDLVKITKKGPDQPVPEAPFDDLNPEAHQDDLPWDM